MNNQNMQNRLCQPVPDHSVHNLCYFGYQKLLLNGTK